MSQPTSHPRDFGLSEEYWARISEKEHALYERIRPLRKSVYQVQNHLSRIEDTLAQFEREAVSMGGCFELCPDFQRGHVWTHEQQVAYVESFLRGAADATIEFNNPSMGTLLLDPGDLHPYSMVCVDGLQRLTALREYMAGRVKVFGGLSAEDLKGTSFDANRYTWTLKCFDFPTRAQLLQHYLDLNAGGTPHSAEEIARVRQLRAEAAAPPARRKRSAKA